MRQLFGELREKYDYVIVDLPPLAPVVDVRAAIHLFDCFLFVVEWGKTKIDVADHALATNRGVFDNLLGVILNKVDSNRLRYYDFNRKQYYHNEYYAQYHTD
jgi:succinoglycan biosynthesis transport protein ExoP